MVTVGESSHGATVGRDPPPFTTGPRRVVRPPGRSLWWLGFGALVVAAVVFVILTRVRPAYDAYGWLVWGRQALRGNLDTNAAPSWKPLPFLFTLPYSLLGRDALWLWMVTAVAGGLAAPVFAARIAYRLSGSSSGRPYAPVLAAGFAAVGVACLGSYWHFVLIAYADPLMMGLCLAAIDCRLTGRRILAWWLLVFVALGRPEAWPLVLLYGLAEWRAAPALRRQLLLGGAAVPLAWFLVPALTSHSWMIAGDVAHESGIRIGGNKIAGVLRQFAELYPWPLQVAALLALAVGALVRDRTWLVLAGAVALWLATEIAFAFHGLPTPARYVFEPAAVVVVLAGAALGRVLALTSRRVLFHCAAAVGVVALVVALAPHAHVRARLAHNGILLGRTWARQLDRLHGVIGREGGPRRILSCGQAVTEIAYQSILAWELGQNVADVGWDPATSIRAGGPIVLFSPVAAGWEVRAIHPAGADHGRCSRLRAATATT